MERIRILKGDLTAMNVDAIVNAANNELVLGGGLAAAIRKKGGPDIQKECNRHGPVSIGEAAITGGGKLKAHYVIHAASMSFSVTTTDKSLKDSTLNSLKRAEEMHLQSIAFPAIGTGIAGFPVQRCADIMLDIFITYEKRDSSIKDVYMVLYDDDTYRVFLETYRRLTKV